MIKVKAYAKLNLNLHILPDLKYKKETGYYPVRFINCELDLHDDLLIDDKKREITFTCNNKELSNHDNLVYKAAYLLKQEINNPSLGAKIILKKQIPVKAGLGGGSSDAAATIKALLTLWKVNISAVRISKIIQLLGSDVFYSMQGGLCKIDGKGELVRKLTNHLPRLWLVLISPDIFKPSTSWMYGQINIDTIGANLNKYKQLKQAMVNSKKAEIFYSLHNDFEDIIEKQYLTVKKIKKDLSASGSVKELIAGSGLTVVGFYPSKQMALKGLQKLEVKYKNIICTHTR